MFLLVVIGFLSVALIIFSLTERRYPSLKKLPGPSPNFFMGNLIDFMGPTSEFLNTLRSYTKYGTVARVYDGPINSMIAVYNKKFIEYILSSPKLIDKADHYDFLQEWLGTGLLTSTGTKWKQRRRMLTPLFHFSILQNFIEVFDSVGDIFIQKLNVHVGEDSFDIYPLVTLCTLDVICEATMGTSIHAQLDGNSEYVRCVKIICAVIVNRIFSVLPRVLYPLTLSYYREKAALKVIHKYVDKIIDERIKKLNASKEEFSSKNRLAFLDLLIKSEIDGVPLSRSDIREEVNTFMFEGHDTISSALSFTLYCLATHPEVQKKAFEEQCTIFGDQKNPKPTLADLQNMKYLELVIKETLRLYPSVPFVGRKVSEDFEYEGVLYPRGLHIFVSIFMSHEHPEYFPNPTKFIPERFEDGNVETFTYYPFSAGPRNCIGQKFAMLELKTIISKVLRNFELFPPTPEYKMAIAPELILISKNGIKISLRRR